VDTGARRQASGHLLGGRQVVRVDGGRLLGVELPRDAWHGVIYPAHEVQPPQVNDRPVLAWHRLGGYHLLREDHARRRAGGLLGSADVMGDPADKDLRLAGLARRFRDDPGGEVAGPQLPVWAPYAPCGLVLITGPGPDHDGQGGGFIRVGDQPGEHLRYAPFVLPVRRRDPVQVEEVVGADGQVPGQVEIPGTGGIAWRGLLIRAACPGVDAMDAAGENPERNADQLAAAVAVHGPDRFAGIRDPRYQSPDVLQVAASPEDGVQRDHPLDCPADRDDSRLFVVFPAEGLDQ